MAYPEFVPWITSMRTWNLRRIGEGVDSLDAEAGIGFSFLQESFSTRVTRNSNSRLIEVKLLAGPFRRLTNSWRFTDAPSGTRVEFDIDFEFKSRALEILLKANFHRAVERLMTCFDERAASLYGAAQNSVADRTT